MSKSERYILLHKELWEAFCDSFPSKSCQHPPAFLWWLRDHRGIYQPACLEYLEILEGMNATN